jgi:hypothetical protein
MKLKALHKKGKLDISSSTTLGRESEEVDFRLSLSPGQIVTVSDKWRKLKNIDSAINSGYLEVLSYDDSPGVEVIQDKASTTVETLDGTKDPGDGYTFSLGTHKHDGAGGGGVTTHTALTDMPDLLGTNTGHDTRYICKVQDTEPTVPAPFAGMFWLDTSV